MNEFLREFIMTAIRDMIDKDVALYQTYQYASGWFEKGVLMQEDLQEISALYEKKSTVEETTKNDAVVEKNTAEEKTEESEGV